jgi:hypothetical protein
MSPLCAAPMCQCVQLRRAMLLLMLSVGLSLSVLYARPVRADVTPFYHCSAIVTTATAAAV